MVRLNSSMARAAERAPLSLAVSRITRSTSPIILGRETTGLSIFRPVDGLDEGPVLLQREVQILPDDTIGITAELLDEGREVVLVLPAR